MKIVTIIEDNPITGVRYGTAEVTVYNNIIKRRLDRYHRLRNKLIRNKLIHNQYIASRTKHK